MGVGSPGVAATGGASPYGLLANITALASDFATTRSGAPTGAIGAIIRQHLGPTGYADDFAGSDALLFLNLSGVALANPFLGADPLGGAQGFSDRQMEDGDIGYLTANPVPEPATAGILGLALLGLAGLRRRRG